jgi:hypothetical protein
MKRTKGENSRRWQGKSVEIDDKNGRGDRAAGGGFPLIITIAVSPVSYPS